MLFRNLTTILEEIGCQGGQGSPRAVAPSEEEEGEEEPTRVLTFPKCCSLEHRTIRPKTQQSRVLYTIVRRLFTLHGSLCTETTNSSYMDTTEIHV
jgi:hypothetical protein